MVTLNNSLGCSVLLFSSIFEQICAILHLINLFCPILHTGLILNKTVKGYSELLRMLPRGMPDSGGLEDQLKMRAWPVIKDKLSINLGQAHLPY